MPSRQRTDTCAPYALPFDHAQLLRYNVPVPFKPFEQCCPLHSAWSQVHEYWWHEAHSRPKRPRGLWLFHKCIEDEEEQR